MTSSRKRFLEFRRNGLSALAQADDDSAPRHHSSDPVGTDAKNGKNTGGRKVRRPGVLRDYLRLLRPFAFGIAAVIVVALISAGTSMLVPWATMHMIDKVLPARDYGRLHLIGFTLLAMVCVQQCFDWWRHWKLARLNVRILFRMRRRLYKHLLRLPLHELNDMRTGGVTTRLSGDIDSLSNLLDMGLITPIVAGIKVFTVIAILLWINWQMAIAAVLLLPPIVLLNLFSMRRIRPIHRSIRRDRSGIDGRVVETFGGIRVVRAFRREAAEARRFAVEYHTVMRKELLAVAYEYLVWSAWGFLIPLCALVVIWLGGVLVLRGSATIGGIMAFQMYLIMLLMPVSAIVQSFGQTQKGIAALERVFEILGRPIDKPDRPNAIGIRQIAAAVPMVQTIEFDDVSFGYRAERTVLKNISLSVQGGWTVALVGPSGAGKTTLTNLVARFYDPDTGAIRLNGVDLRDIRLSSYRSLLGLVQQDTFLFDGTVEENIAYARRSAPRAAVEDAARRANAHDFIMAFPEGYATMIGERGVKLSGGQAQRLSIARALLADPQILILDEATSNLDSESEQLIQASLHELLSERTTFVIAHRLSTVVNADLIVVLEDGRVTETGTHDELLARNGQYRSMVERQQRALREDAEAANWLA